MPTIVKALYFKKLSPVESNMFSNISKSRSRIFDEKTRTFRQISKINEEATGIKNEDCPRKSRTSASLNHGDIKRRIGRILSSGAYVCEKILDL